MSATQLKLLDHLQGRMNVVSNESNSFANKYLIGGIIVIIGLLNMDLVIESSLMQSTATSVTTIYLIVILIIGVYYFIVIGKRILRFERAYRKTKLKYETVLYRLLKDEELIKQLETDIHDLTLPTEAISFDHLRAHHRKKYKNINLLDKVFPAIIIVALTFVAKIFQIWLL